MSVPAAPGDPRHVVVHAYSFAATFKLKELFGLFEQTAAQAGGSARVANDQIVASLGERRYVVAYDFGALVVFGADAADEKRLVAQLHERVGKSEPHAPLTEDFIVEIREGGEVEARFDRVVVPALTESVVEIVGLVLAQSVAMDYYAEDVEQIEIETDRITAGLRAGGRIPGRTRDVVRFIGQCIGTRNDIISTLALFDKPDSVWDSEPLDRLWNGLYRALDLDDRYRTLETKLRMIQDNLVLLADLARSRHTLFLEIAVVFLILAETVVMLWQVAGQGGH